MPHLVLVQAGMPLIVQFFTASRKLFNLPMGCALAVKMSKLAVFKHLNARCQLLEPDVLCKC